MGLNVMMTCTAKDVLSHGAVNCDVPVVPGRALCAKHAAIKDRLEQVGVDVSELEAQRMVPRGLATVLVDDQKRFVGGTAEVPHVIGTADANTPEYYRSANGMQPWDVIDEWGLGYYEGSAVRYILRAGRKRAGVVPASEAESFVKDIKKARHFLDRVLARYEAKK